MSKWTDIRDGALDTMKQGALNVAEETKQNFMRNFSEAGVPVIESYADLFTDTVKKQAENETGWNKIRDAVVIPVAVKTLLFVGKQIISLIPTGTANEQTQNAANA